MAPPYIIHQPIRLQHFSKMAASMVCCMHVLLDETGLILAFSERRWRTFLDFASRWRTLEGPEKDIADLYEACQSESLPNSELGYHKSRSSHSIVRYAFVYIMRLTGHTHDRESPIQNFSTAPKKLGAHISRPVWPPKPTEFVTYLVN